MRAYKRDEVLRWTPEARVLLGLDHPVKVRGIAEGHRRYLGWHRGKIFKM